MDAANTATNNVTNSNNNISNNNSELLNGNDVGEQLFRITCSSPNTSTLYYEMYKDEKFVDVTLSCNTLQVRAHKMVLSACSPYFYQMFDKVSTTCNQHPIVVLKDMPADNLRLILDFIYLGEIQVTQRKLISLIKSAEGLQINGLCSNIPSNGSNNNLQSMSYSNNNENHNAVTVLLQQKQQQQILQQLQFKQQTNLKKSSISSVSKFKGNIQNKVRGNESSSYVELRNENKFHINKLVSQQQDVGSQGRIPNNYINDNNNQETIDDDDVCDDDIGDDDQQDVIDNEDYEDYDNYENYDCSQNNNKPYKQIGSNNNNSDTLSFYPASNYIEQRYKVNNNRHNNVLEDDDNNINLYNNLNDDDDDDNLAVNNDNEVENVDDIDDCGDIDDDDVDNDDDDDDNDDIINNDVDNIYVNGDDLNHSNRNDDDNDKDIFEQPFMTIGDKIGNKKIGSSSGNQSSLDIPYHHSSKESSLSLNNHTCNICFKSFKEKANLKRHSQVHTSNRRKFNCPKCDKTFNWRANLIRHLNSPAHRDSGKLKI